jgi:hypothetical protein
MVSFKLILGLGKDNKNNSKKKQFYLINNDTDVK